MKDETFSGVPVTSSSPKAPTSESGAADRMTIADVLKRFPLLQQRMHQMAGTLSGGEVLRILHEFGFARVSQRGSHVKVRRLRSDGVRESLTVPLHDELDRGTLHTLYRQAARFVPESDLRPRFYLD